MLKPAGPDDYRLAHPIGNCPLPLLLPLHSIGPEGPALFCLYNPRPEVRGKSAWQLLLLLHSIGPEGPALFCLYNPRPEVRGKLSCPLPTATATATATAHYFLSAEVNILFQLMPFRILPSLVENQIKSGFPTIWSSGTKPQTRESSELWRLSPIIQ
jgi:hypothetical protein